VKFSLRVNNDLTVTQLVDLALRAERHGFDQLWLSNDLFLRSAPVLLAVVAQQTSSIRLGTGILNPYSTHPAEIAMVAASLQEVSGGRFLLGLAAGAEEFLGWAGIPRPRPLGRTREAVHEIRALCAGERPSRTPGTGPGWSDEGHLRTPPRPTPIYLGAMSPKMLALAGAVADGALPLLYPPEHFTTARAQIHGGAERAGRDLTGFDLPACVWCSVDADPVAARGALAEKIAYYGASFAPYLLERAGLHRDDFAGIQRALAAGRPEEAKEMVTPAMLRLGIAGTPEGVTTRCRELVSAGAEHISFGPPLGPDLAAAVDLLGTEVLPALREG
jgi:5,10-methylenetetrahydromethanopterin reductase